MALSKAPRVAPFSGTFAKIHNPFTRETLSTYKSGTYIDMRGIIWMGEFDYIPIRETADLSGYGKTFFRSGAFVFVGVKIDPELDEVVRGLFISGPTRPEENIRFTRARPDYLEKLRAAFVADRAENAAELAESKRARRELFNTILTGATTAAVIYGNARAMAAVDRAMLDSMTGVVRGERLPATAGTLTPQHTGSATGKATSPISVAEFRKLQSAANRAAPVTRSASTRSQQAARPPTPNKYGTAAPKNNANVQRNYPGLPLVRTSKRDESNLTKKQADAWCSIRTKKIEAEFVGSPNDFIRLGPCTCNIAEGSVSNAMSYGSDYYCQVDLTWRQNVPDFSSR